MIRVGVVLLCRYSSSRLPGKIFREIEGKPIIDYIIERILSVVPQQDFCVATSEEKTDDAIAAYCEKRGIYVFRGSLKDVASRFIQAASSQGWDYAVRINGDNLFVETDVLKHLIGLARTGQYDFLTNTHHKTFPQGMSVEVVNTQFFRQAYSQFSQPEDFEHVTFFLHHHEVGKYFFYDNETCPEAIGLKFAIDEEKDLELGRSIIAAMKDSHLKYKMKEIVQLYKQLRNE